MKPTVPEVLPIVEALYKRHGAGCCWHVVLDDGNVSDKTVWECIGHYAMRCREPECHQLAVLLPKMSRTQRLKLCSAKRTRA